jgi:hypothetical protein
MTPLQVNGTCRKWLRGGGREREVGNLRERPEGWTLVWFEEIV